MSRPINIVTIATILLAGCLVSARVENLFAFSPPSAGFLMGKRTFPSHGQMTRNPYFALNATTDVETHSTTEQCFWKTPGGRWEPRVDIQNLRIGQNLTGVVFQELLNGTTGPKLFLDCGIGRRDKPGKWQIVTGMLRLGGKGMKESVINKKATKLRKKALGISVFVSKIYKMSARIEVVTDEELIQQEPPLVSVSSLKKNQEVVGTVVRLENFGAIVNVGANRCGLLHIQRVADLYGRYIDKVKGLQDAGLEVGARIRVQVAELDKRRLFLDFTADVRKEAADERQRKAEELQKQKEARMKSFALAQQAAVVDSSEPASQSTLEVSDEEAAAWAAYAAGDTDVDEPEDDEDDEYDDEDDDNAIEDALGLGSW